MGSGISTLPAHLTIQEVQNLCGSKFDKGKYDSLKDADGTVLREKIMHEIDLSIEKEVLDLFMIYCPSSEMDSDAFVRLLRDAKLLTKKDLTTVDAETIFHRVRTTTGRSLKTIKYENFRLNCLNEISRKKGIEVKELVSRLSRMEPERLLVGEKCMTARSTIKYDDLNTITDTSRKLLLHSTSESAAIKIQKLHRAIAAKNVLLRLKAIRAILRHQILTENDFPTPVSIHEDKVKSIFQSYCQSYNEISVLQFEKLLSDCKVFDKKFTGGDADNISKS